MFLPLLAPQPVVCLDPGHTSEVGSGTRGRRLTELHFAWVVAKDLESKLKASGVKVVLTKQSEGERVTNRRRSDVANASGASLFLRLHCDAATNSGSTIYYPDRQGRAGGKVGPALTLLPGIRRAALAFHKGYSGYVTKRGLRDNGLKSDVYTAIGAKQGALTGSVWTQVPVVLVEMVVLTNPRDERFAETRRDVIVGGLYAGTMAVLRNPPIREMPRHYEGRFKGGGSPSSALAGR